MDTTARRLILALAVAAVLVWAVAAIRQMESRAAQPADHTIYCQHGSGLPVGFVAGPGLGQGCPPGFRRVSGAR